MSRIVGIAFVLWGAVGCAAFSQGLKEARDGVEPNMAAIPQGQGWFCSIASDKSWHSCARTIEDCRADLDKNKKAAMGQGLFSITFKDCMQAVSAQCFTDEVMETQSNGSAKPVPGAECMPDQMSCSSLSDSFKTQSKYMRVSKCVAVN